MNLKNKVILVTGGAKRVGNAIALTLAKAGAHIIITYRTSEKEAKKTVSKIQKIGRKGLAISADMTSESDAHFVISEVVQKFKRLDVLVNNAANFIKIPFEKLTGQDFDDSIDVNLKGPYLFSIAAGKVMQKQKSGKIINIADWAGIRPYKNYIPYCVSKGGVITLTKALAKSLAPHVQVNAILPGPVLLPENFDPAEKKKIIEATLLKRLGSPEDIAHSIQFLIEADFVTGAILPVDGGRLIA